MSDAIRVALAALSNGSTPSPEVLDGAFGAVIAGDATPSQIGALLMGFERIGVSGEVIAAGARAMRAAMVRVDLGEDLIDVCGTGGDGAHTLNVSTAVGFVVAGCGVRVAKHGNRAMSSKSGAGDVLEALGVNLALSPGALAAAMKNAGIAFLFAQNHHPAMRHVAGPRRELGFRTVFNLLGPLSNPAGARRQLTGVFSGEKLMPIAEAMLSLGTQAAWVVHGHGGVDELALSGPSHVVALEGGALRSFSVTPGDAGLSEAAPDAIRGGDAAFNAAALTALLDGETGAYRDVVLLNAAAALIVADKADDLRDGVAMAATAIDSGKARGALAALVSATCAAAQ